MKSQWTVDVKMAVVFRVLIKARAGFLTKLYQVKGKMLNSLSPLSGIFFCCWKFVLNRVESRPNTVNLAAK